MASGMGPCRIAQATLSKTPETKLVAPTPGWWRVMFTNRSISIPVANWMSSTVMKTRLLSAQ
jgi:hypothetical protein